MERRPGCGAELQLCCMLDVSRIHRIHHATAAEWGLELTVFEKVPVRLSTSTTPVSKDTWHFLPLFLLLVESVNHSFYFGFPFL